MEVKMENKDWILLFIPILFNGIFIFSFQKAINGKIEKTKKRNNLRDEVIFHFWQKFKELNTELLQANDDIQQGRIALEEGLTNIRNQIVEIIKYYDTNSYDLELFKEKFDNWHESWLIFTKQTNKESAGKKLQLFKDNTVGLINLIREKY